jgi:hypothetical protein
MCSAAEIVLLDEPIAAMGAKESAAILGVIVLVAHNYDYVLGFCDRVNLIEDGCIARDNPDVRGLGRGTDEPDDGIRSAALTRQRNGVWRDRLPAAASPLRTVIARQRPRAAELGKAVDRCQRRSARVGWGVDQRFADRGEGLAAIVTMVLVSLALVDRELRRAALALSVAVLVRHRGARAAPATLTDRGRVRARHRSGSRYRASDAARPRSRPLGRSARTPRPHRAGDGGGGGACSLGVACGALARAVQRIDRPRGPVPAGTTTARAPDNDPPLVA